MSTKDLDRLLERAGLAQEGQGAAREFVLAGRTLRVRAQGKGVWRVEAYVDGELDAVSHVGRDRLERLIARAAA